jgi:hypothetical protein
MKNILFWCYFILYLRFCKAFSWQATAQQKRSYSQISSNRVVDQ